MFGFLRPETSEFDYRRIYAGCCSFQHRKYGLETLPFLSYEAVFLYVLAVDAGICARPAADTALCCRLRRSGTRIYQVDDRIAEFCAAFGLLLTSIKLDDDIRDGSSVLARFARWRLRRRLERAGAYFSQFDPGFQSRVQGFIDGHLALERSGRRWPLDTYAEPTASAFAYLFGLYARHLGNGAVEEDTAREVGAELGRAIILFDCAVDWHRDRRRGEFNPLTGASAVRKALHSCCCSLSAIGWRCANEFGGDSLSAAVVRAVFDRVARRNRDHRRTQSRVSKSRPRWARAGDCDCACDAGGCDGCDCCSPAGCAVDACVDCWWPCADRSSRRAEEHESSTEPESPATSTVQVGTRARTIAPLNPSGVVEIDGQQLPARTTWGWIDSDQLVEVIESTGFGVVVKPVDAEVQPS